MKKALILYLLLAANWLMGSQHSLVFIHIGQELPQYIYIAIEQARLFNPTIPIYLIYNNGATHNEEVLKKSTIKMVTCESLKRTSNHKLFLQNSTLEGFWRNASERFFYLDELMAQRNLKNVFHLENDNMLYVELSDLLPIFRDYKAIAAVFDNDNRCIPGFVYISSSKALRLLVSYFAENARKGLNDMEILPLFKKQHGLQMIDHLPIITPKYVDQHVLKNALGDVVVDSTRYSNKFDSFKSIFDGAALGQYLGGIHCQEEDKRIGFINERCVFNPSYLSYQWTSDSKNRKIPYAIFNGEAIKINNLHIHSKNLDQFKS